MDEKRMGEIALAIVKDHVQEEMTVGAKIGRALGNQAKRFEIPLEELKEFYRILAMENVEKYLS